MKLWHLIALILIIAFVGGAIFLKLWSTPSTPVQTNQNQQTGGGFTGGTTKPPAEADQFAAAFYNWYLQNLKQNPTFPDPDIRNQIFAPWLSSNFIANWDTIGNTIDADPALLASDNPETWGPGVFSSLLSQTSSTATVRVTVGSGTSAHGFIVKLVKGSDGGWRIDSVASAS